MLMHPGPGVDGPGPGVMTYQPAAPQVAAVVANPLRRAGGNDRPMGRDRAGPFRLGTAGGARPLQLPAGRHVSPEAGEHPGPAGRGTLSDVGSWPAMPRTEAFLAHNAIPVQFTEEDFDQVLTGQLRDQGDLPARSGVPGTGLGRRRDAGQHAARAGRDPIVEADRRGAILAIVRLGNKDLAIASATAERWMAGRCRWGCKVPARRRAMWPA